MAVVEVLKTRNIKGSKAQEQVVEDNAPERQYIERDIGILPLHPMCNKQLYFWKYLQSGAIKIIIL